MTPRPNPLLPPVNPTPMPGGPNAPTVVSITFDDGWASAAIGAQLLADHHLAGTFYVNSGTIGQPGHVTLAQLDTIAEQGNEIGGHSLTHPDLTDLTVDEATRQICTDRDTLLGWGFPVRNFAYPFSQSSPDLEKVVAHCGYNSARSLGELRPFLPDPRNPLSCSACTTAETVPPPDPYYVKAPREVNNDWQLADLEGQVTNGYLFGNGWVPITFHKLCTTDCTNALDIMPDSSSIAFPQDQYDRFLTWLADQQAQGNLIVKTVGDVIGGPVQPPVAGPVAPSRPDRVANPGLEQPGPGGVPACWTHAGFGTNSPEFSLVPSAHSGNTASRLVMRGYVDGDAKLLQTMDLGTCAPAVSPGRTYTIQAWYTSTVPTQFSVQYRLARGIWVNGLSSPKFPPAKEFTAARWTLPPVPDGVTAVSFGLTLAENGELVTDDYSLTADTQSPP